MPIYGRSRNTNRRTIVYPTHLTEFTKTLRNPNVRILNEMVHFYGDIETGCRYWDENAPSQFIDFESAQGQTQDYTLRHSVGRWMNLAEYAELGGHALFLGGGSWRSNSRRRDNPSAFLA
jgi:hypothetical protein